MRTFSMKFKRTQRVKDDSPISEPPRYKNVNPRYKNVNSRLASYTTPTVDKCHAGTTYNKYYIKTTITLTAVPVDNYDSSLFLINSRLFVGDTCPKYDIGTIKEVCIMNINDENVTRPDTSDYPLSIKIVSVRIKEQPVTTPVPAKPISTYLTLYNMTCRARSVGNFVYADLIQDTSISITKTNPHKKGTPYRAPIAGYRKVLCETPYVEKPVKTSKPGCYDTRIRSGMQSKQKKLIVTSSEKPYSYSYSEYHKNRIKNTYDRGLEQRNEAPTSGICECEAGRLKSNWNPSNDKFKVQGAVSSSGRIDRLKLDTLRATNSKCDKGNRCNKCGEGKGKYFAGKPRFDGWMFNAGHKEIGRTTKY